VTGCQTAETRASQQQQPSCR